MLCPNCRNDIENASDRCPYCGTNTGIKFNAGGGLYGNPAGTAAMTGSQVVQQATEVQRAEFIRRTYTHMAGAILFFILLESILLDWSGAKNLVSGMVKGYNWLIVLAAFMGVSYIADKWARSNTSKQMQYLGLGLYAAAEAVIFLPLLYIAKNFAGPQVIGAAGIVTIGLFAGLTAVVFTTRKDFSFLRNILSIGGFIALGVIVAATLFGFSLGVLFAAIMVGFAAAAILYSTSNILREYRTDQYVAASLSLFASIMLLFWYILQIFLHLDE